MDLFGITDGKKCEDICKYAPPENKWPCVDCDMRCHDRAEPKDAKEQQYGQMKGNKITNKDKFRKAFGYDGSIVAECFPGDCGQLGSCGYPSCSESCASRYFPRCPHWWNDEYSTDYTDFDTKRNERR